MRSGRAPIDHRERAEDAQTHAEKFHDPRLITYAAYNALTVLDEIETIGNRETREVIYDFYKIPPSRVLCMACARVCAGQLPMGSYPRVGWSSCRQSMVMHPRQRPRRSVRCRRVREVAYP